MSKFRFSSGSRRKPLAVVLTVAIAGLGLSVAPLAVSSASAASASSLKADILKDLNKWRAAQGAAPIKINSRLEAAVAAEGAAQLGELTGDATAFGKYYVAFASLPTGGTDSFTGGGFAEPGSTSAMALDIAQGIEAEDDSATFESDNYAGVAVLKLGGKWEGVITAYHYTSFVPQSSKPHVTLTGSTEVGGTLTAHSSIKASSTTQVSFEWLIGGDPISDAGNTLVIPAGTPPFFGGDSEESLIGQRITVVELVTQGSKDPNASSATSAKVTLANVKSAAVSVTGDRYVGDTLSAVTNESLWQPAATSFSYQWYRDDFPIATADDPEYTQVAADVNHEITVRVTGTDIEDGYLPTSVKTTTSVKTGGPLLTNTTAPSITINTTLAVGQTLTADAGEWTDGTSTTAQTFTYQWKIGGVAVSGATSSTFVIPASAYSASGKAITVVVTAHESGYSNTPLESAATATVAQGVFDITGTPNYSGTLAVGKTIKAVLPTFSPKPTTITYAWQIGGVTKSTSSSYKLPASAVGHAITLLITVSRAGYLTASIGDDDIEVPGTIG